MSDTWNLEQVWGSDRFLHEGDVAEEQYAFVIDSGISLDTNDLNVNQEWSKSFTSNSNPFDDESGHGTAVASVIGSKANGEGLTGVAPGAQVVALKVFDQGGTLRTTVEKALQHAKKIILENDLIDKSVVNLSLGGARPDNHPTVAELNELGIKVVVSAGNQGRDADEYSPASYGRLENVYTVSSNDKKGWYSSFTNFDSDDGYDVVDYTAPGTYIPTYNTDGTIGYRNGTSFSAPHVAGLLLMSEEIKAGETFNLTQRQRQNDMIGDPRAMFDLDTYKHQVEPEPIIIEVPVYVEVPVYIDVPGPVVEVPVYIDVPVPVDPIVGNWGKDNKLRGTGEDDVIYGGRMNDHLRGGFGNDTLLGFGGNDKLKGGNGDDVLYSGNTGKTKMKGGEGSDTFYLSEGYGSYSVIRDFDPIFDTIVVPGEYELQYKDNLTKIMMGDDLIAKVTGIFTEM